MSFAGRSPLLPSIPSRSVSGSGQDAWNAESGRESELASRKSSVTYDEYNGTPVVVYEDEEKPRLSLLGARARSISKASTIMEPIPEFSWFEYWTNWSEDGAGLIIAFAVFTFTTILAFERQNVEDYAERKQWPLGMAGVGFFVVISAHFIMKKQQELEAYGAMIVIAIAARAIGEYNVLKNAGLSASFWAIIIGILFRYFGLKSAAKVVSGEFFIKIGVTLLAMDFSNIAKIGLPGLMVAWGDTLIVVALGTMFAIKVMGMDLKDSLVVAGATSICGSSAATAISAAIHVHTDPNAPVVVDKACSTVIALMGMLSTPLMPLLPLLRTEMNVNPVVVGSWIGGSVDSTGQVIASASLGGSDVLESATIVKMAQNVLIGPICLALTVYFQKSFKPSILLDKFPLFVVGFFITSLVANIIRLSNASEDVSDLTISNTWFISEWINLVGFARIGLQIDVNAFIKNSSDHTILYTYLAVQCLDLITTFGWSWLLFHTASYEDDDSE